MHLFSNTVLIVLLFCANSCTNAVDSVFKGRADTWEDRAGRLDMNGKYTAFRYGLEEIGVYPLGIR